MLMGATAPISLTLRAPPSSHHFYSNVIGYAARYRVLLNIPAYAYQCSTPHMLTRAARPAQIPHGFITSRPARISPSSPLQTPLHDVLQIHPPLHQVLHVAVFERLLPAYHFCAFNLFFLLPTLSDTAGRLLYRLVGYTNSWVWQAKSCNSPPQLAFHTMVSVAYEGIQQVCVAC